MICVTFALRFQLMITLLLLTMMGMTDDHHSVTMPIRIEWTGLETFSDWTLPMIDRENNSTAWSLDYCLQLLLFSHAMLFWASYFDNITSSWLVGWCLTSHSTHYRSFRERILQARWPNQQCQSTEGNQLVVEIRLESQQNHSTMLQ